MRYLKVASGPLLFLLVLYLPLIDISSDARYTLAITCWIAAWWIAEALPLAITALLPIILFPMAGIVSISDTTQAYASPIIFLFLGGFLLALAVEKWDLHKRIALGIINGIGASPSKIILGFMLSTAILSMWISNTATALMLLPIGLALYKEIVGLISHKKQGERFGKALMLSIAYAASIGGMATLIGTPTNLIFVNTADQLFQDDISFANWFLFGLPVASVLLIIAFFYLTRVAFKIGQISIQDVGDTVRKEKVKLGPISYEEKCVLLVFSLVSFFWITRSFLWEQFIPGINDTIIALIGACSLFIIPANKESRLMGRSAINKLPWDILLLFGGGLAIANGFNESGLALWIGENMNTLQKVHPIIILFVMVTGINFLTEITSNVATAAVLMPVLAAVAASLAIHPYILMVATSMTASCAFMLPVATPPNAIIFGSGILTIKDMVRAGIVMNIISIIIIALAHYFILPWLWNI